MLQWTPDNHPPALDSLDASTQEVALEQANRSLARGKHPIRALSMGIAHALAAAEGELPSSGTFFYVQPTTAGGRWLLTHEGEDAREFNSLDDALYRAGELARKAGSGVCVCDAEGGLVDRYEFHQVEPQQVVVAPQGDGWAVTQPGRTATAIRADTKLEAVRAGRELARRAGGALRIHYVDGGIQAEHHYNHA